MTKKILVIGCGNAPAELIKAIRMVELNNICDLHNVVDSQFTEPIKDKVFEFTKLPEFEEPWVDPDESIYNYHKQQQTFAKNRKKRKRKRR